MAQKWNGGPLLCNSQFHSLLNLSTLDNIIFHEHHCLKLNTDSHGDMDSRPPAVNQKNLLMQAVSCPLIFKHV